LFKEVEITPQMKTNAKKKAEEMGTIKGSVRGGGGNEIGFLGEELIKSYLGIDDGNTYEFDLMYNDNKLEVKTKERNVVPQMNYNATVFSWNTHQQCDYYVFCSIFKNFERGWICGCIKPEDFKKNSVFAKKGDPDGKYFKFFTDCYNMPYSKLLDIALI
jgi:hypothetical protein